MSGEASTPNFDELIPAPKTSPPDRPDAKASSEFRANKAPTPTERADEHHKAHLATLAGQLQELGRGYSSLRVENAEQRERIEELSRENAESRTAAKSTGRLPQVAAVFAGIGGLVVGAAGTLPKLSTRSKWPRLTAGPP